MTSLTFNGENIFFSFAFQRNGFQLNLKCFDVYGSRENSMKKDYKVHLEYFASLNLMKD